MEDIRSTEVEKPKEETEAVPEIVVKEAGENEVEKAEEKAEIQPSEKADDKKDVEEDKKMEDSHPNGDSHPKGKAKKDAKADAKKDAKVAPITVPTRADSDVALNETEEPSPSVATGPNGEALLPEDSVEPVTSDAAWGAPVNDPVSYLCQYGYEPENMKDWKTGANFPEFKANVMYHAELFGNTLYVIECVVKVPNQNISFEWTCRRRLVHLRQHMHDTVASDLGRESYLKYFEATPFAKRGAPVGTTGRLRAWVNTLTECISNGLLSPQRVSQIFRFMEPPPASTPSSPTGK